MQIDILGVPVNYEEFGSGRPVLMLHGSPTDHRSMMTTMEPLFEGRTGWRRLYPDFPGHGKTPGADWITSQDDMLKVMLGFVDKVAPDERFTVVGVSYGGYVARGVVHERADQLDGAMFMVPLIIADESKVQLPAFRVLHEDPAFLAALRPDEGFLKEMSVAQSMELLLEARPLLESFADADMKFLERVGEKFDFSFEVDKLETPFPAPSLFVTGRFDSNCGYRDAYALLDNYPRATFAVLDRAGHLLGGEQPGLFRALSKEWLDRVEEYIAKSAT